MVTDTDFSRVFVLRAWALMAGNSAGWLESWLEYEKDFKGMAWIDMTRDHSELPIFAVCIYLAIVFRGPGMLNGRKWELRPAVAFWNLALALGSMIGTQRTVPHLLDTIQSRGFKYTVCTHPSDWYLDGAVGLWVGLFIFSKASWLRMLYGQNIHTARAGA